MPTSDNIWPLTRKHQNLYGQVVWMATSRKEYGKALKFLGANKLEKNIGGISQVFENVKTKAPVYLIGWFNGDVATLAHECSHMAFNILAAVGIPVTHESNEAHAYLLAAIMRDFLRLEKCS